jgi:rhodanese-related sulfurtransferase
MSNQTILPIEVSAALGGGEGTLVDVRTPAEYREVHVPGAHLAPLDVFDRAAVDTIRGADPGPVYLLCASGIRAAKAADKLRGTGLENVLVVAGGTNAWVAAGLPVVRGRKTISIERQVRIGAGLLVLIGTGLGWFVQRNFFILAALVGAGLVFAGVTDICGLAIVLAKAPWNRSGKTTPVPGPKPSSTPVPHPENTPPKPT